MAVAPPPPPPPTFSIVKADVSPARALYGGRPVEARLRFRASAPVDVRIQIERRGGGVARRFDLRGVSPPGPVVVRWNGRVRGGREAREGRYVVRAGRRGGRLRTIGRFTFRRHIYPVRGRHWFRGPIGRFGAGRSGGRTHEGFDINARCGTRVVAARAGPGQAPPLRPRPLRQLRDRPQRERAARLLVLAPALARPGPPGAPGQDRPAAGLGGQDRQRPHASAATCTSSCTRAAGRSIPCPGCGPGTGSPSPLGRPRRPLRRTVHVGPLAGEQEHLDGDVVLQIGLAGERAHLAPRGLLDQGLELVGHDQLEVAADLLDVLSLAVRDQRALGRGEGLLQARRPPGRPRRRPWTWWGHGRSTCCGG